jgi:2-polyprenyl-3-methyl-5-hydroxy-6-metoxy-1,4-benzoquinol methylase
VTAEFEQPGSRNADAPAAAAPYEGYAQWQGWSDFLVCEPLYAEYFAAEFRGLALRDKDLLEIGFGPGRLLGWARAQGARVSGVEVNPWSLDCARRAGIAVPGQDFSALGAELSDTLDLIVAFDVFEHLSHRAIRDHLEAATKTLRAGGVLMLRYPNAQSPFGLPAQHGDASHVSALSRAIIERLCEGLPLATERYAGACRARGVWGPKRLARMLRFAAQDLAEASIRALYGFGEPMSPVVVHMLRRAER